MTIFAGMGLCARAALLSAFLAAAVPSEAGCGLSFCPRPEEPGARDLELGFMAYLIERESAAGRAGNRPVAAALRREQRHFLMEHLARWAPIFGAVLGEVAGSPLYRAVGGMFETFVLDDLESLGSAD